MLTYITVSIENDYINGGVRIKSAANIAGASGISTVVISKKIYNTSAWSDIYVIDVNTADDLNFDLLDILTLSGTTYSYNIEIMGSDGVTPLEFEMFENIKSQFEGLFVGDFNQFYVAGSNFKTETKRNIQVEYVTTLSGKYPYRISNADTNYTTGTSSGLFLQLTNNKKSFVPDSFHQYTDRVLNFLCDGFNKILKTHDGQMWLVSIDPSPCKIYSDFNGMHVIQFNWTEIGDIPTAGMVDMTGMVGE